MDSIKISEKLDALVGVQIIETISLNLPSGIIGRTSCSKSQISLAHLE